MVDLNPLLRAIKYIRCLYPDLKRGEISNDAINSAITNGGAALSKLMPLIEQYAYLRVRGHQNQASFTAVFMADTGSYLMHGLNRSFNGVHLLEATSVYKSAHRAEWESIGVYDLWNDQIAIAEFERLAEDAGEDTQIGRAARRIRDSVVAYKSTMKAGLQRRVRLH